MESTSTWIITIAVLAAMILFDLGIAVIRRNKKTSMLEAIASLGN
jgi:tellurite resistance protein TerC